MDLRRVGEGNAGVKSRRAIHPRARLISPLSGDCGGVGECTSNPPARDATSADDGHSYPDEVISSDNARDDVASPESIQRAARCDPSQRARRTWSAVTLGADCVVHRGHSQGSRGSGDTNPRSKALATLTSRTTKICSTHESAPATARRGQDPAGSSPCVMMYGCDSSLVIVASVPPKKENSAFICGVEQLREFKVQVCW